MIDIRTESLIAVRDVPRRLPVRPNGRRLHVSAVYRWIQRGVGGVRLEAVRIGGTTYTSLEAMQRFADRQGTPALQVPDPVNPVSRSRQKQIDEASRAAEAILQRKDPAVSARGSNRPT